MRLNRRKIALINPNENDIMLLKDFDFTILWYQADEDIEKFLKGVDFNSRLVVLGGNCSNVIRLQAELISPEDIHTIYTVNMYPLRTYPYDETTDIYVFLNPMKVLKLYNKEDYTDVKAVIKKENPRINKLFAGIPYKIITFTP